MKTVQLTTDGIKKHLESTTAEQAIAEYIWNGLDAKASTIAVEFICNDLGGIDEIKVSDNGDGIVYEEIDRKFGVFLDSEKIKARNTSKRISSETHGKDGIGRLTFFAFAEKAEWQTVYACGDEKFAFTITVASNQLINYPYSPKKKVSSDTPTGTVVRFMNVSLKSISPNSSAFLQFLTSEFCWRLLLQENLRIKIGEKLLDAADNIAASSEYCLISTGDPRASVRFVRWENKLHREYSRYYFLDAKGEEKFTDFTSLNKKGDKFFHSVYIQSPYFDNFVFSSPATNQAELEFGFSSMKGEWFKNVVSQTDHLLREERKHFLRKSKEALIDSFEEKGILPSFNSKNFWEVAKHNHLTETVGELYNLQPNLFSGGTIEQKKIFVRLIDQLLDADEADMLYQIIGQVLELGAEEKDELLGVLKSSRLRSVIKTAKLVQDRYRAIEQIKLLNWDEDLGAKEVPHIQTFMESHFWLIGEEFALVVAAEKDFEQALRELYKKINAPKDDTPIDHPDKQKEMDILLVRQDKHHDKIHNVVLELKHPNKKIGKKFIQQIETYYEVISSEPRFNASNMVWSYYLIGNDFDSTGYVEDKLENAKPHGEPSLIHKVRNHKIYVKRWSEIITDVEIRHQFLNDRLEIQRDVLAKEESMFGTADDVIKRAQGLSCAIR
jgi:hypothetical protein